MNVTRKGFLAGMGAVVAARGTASAEIADHASPLRFMVAADIHYRPGVFPHDNKNWLERILARAEDARVAFAIQHLVPAAVGAFVGRVRREFDDVLDRIDTACFATGPDSGYGMD